MCDVDTTSYSPLRPPEQTCTLSVIKCVFRSNTVSALVGLTPGPRAMQLQGQSPATRILCTTFLLTDSLTLDWHPIFNAAAKQAENCLKLEKTGQIIHLPNQTIREQIPRFPMAIPCTYKGGGELVLGC